MKDLLLQARVVVRTSNVNISRRRLADYIKAFIQPIKSMICGVVVDFAVVKS